MRRVIALVVVAAAIAVAAGLALPANAVRVGTSTLATTELNNELDAIHASPSYQCFLAAEAFINPSGSTAVPALPGVTAHTWSNAATLDWTYQRTKQIARIQYVGAKLPDAFSPVSLRVAEQSLETEITTTLSDAYRSTAQPAFSCNGALTSSGALMVGANVLATLPSWFVDEQVRAQSATLGLEALLHNVIPTTGPGLERWYEHNAGLFDTTCVSIIEVGSLDEANELQAAIKAGTITIAEAARRFSLDQATKVKGGAFGCIAPGTNLWQTIYADINPLRIGQVTIFSSGNGQYTLVGPTRRIPNRFAVISATVASEAQLINTQRVSLLAVLIQRGAGVAVNPAIGTWKLTAAGGTITPPDLPPTLSLANPSANTPAP